MKKFFKIVHLYNQLEAISKTINVDFFELVNDIYTQAKKFNSVDNVFSAAENSRPHQPDHLLPRSPRKYDVDHPGIQKLIYLLELYFKTDPNTIYNVQNTGLFNKNLKSPVTSKKFNDFFDYGTALASLEANGDQFALRREREEIITALYNLIEQYDFRGDDTVNEINHTCDNKKIFIVCPEQEFKPWAFPPMLGHIMVDTDVSILMLASHFCNNHLLTKLLSVGCDIDKKSTLSGTTALGFFHQAPTNYLSPQTFNVIKSKLNGTFDSGKFVKIYQQYLSSVVANSIDTTVTNPQANKSPSIKSKKI